MRWIFSFALTGSLTAEPSVSPDGAEDTDPPPDHWQPATGATWHWQIDGDIEEDALTVAHTSVDISDIDLFDAPQPTIASLQSAGVRVLCYFSAGSYEDWRDDASRFDAADIGEPLDDWEGEAWVDIRSLDVRDIITDRLDLAVAKGCDGVEPDNVDGWSNATGFGLTASHQLDYNRWLANEAHSRGLAIALKNDLEQITDLMDDFDLHVDEQCHEYDECDMLNPFVDDDKAVLVAEYANNQSAAETLADANCPGEAAAGRSTVVFPMELDGSWQIRCSDWE